MCRLLCFVFLFVVCCLLIGVSCSLVTVACYSLAVFVDCSLLCVVRWLLLLG